MDEFKERVGGGNNGGLPPIDREKDYYLNGVQNYDEHGDYGGCH